MFSNKYKIVMCKKSKHTIYHQTLQTILSNSLHKTHKHTEIHVKVTQFIVLGLNWLTNIITKTTK